MRTLLSAIIQVRINALMQWRSEKLARSLWTHLSNCTIFKRGEIIAARLGVMLLPSSLAPHFTQSSVKVPDPVIHAPACQPLQQTALVPQAYRLHGPSMLQWGKVVRMMAFTRCVSGAVTGNAAVVYFQKVFGSVPSLFVGYLLLIEIDSRDTSACPKLWQLLVYDSFHLYCPVCLYQRFLAFACFIHP